MTPPFDYNLEHSIIGCMIAEESTRLYAIQYIKPAQFYSDRFRLLFIMLKDLTLEGMSIDWIVAKEEAKRRKSTDPGTSLYDYCGDSEFFSLHNVYAFSIYEYVDSFLDYYRRRVAMTVGLKCFKLATDMTQRVPDVISQVTKMTKNLNEVHTSDIRMLEQYMTETEEEMKDETIVRPMWKTGYRRFDDIILGLFPGEMSLIAARPSVGKTTFAINLALRMSLLYGTQVGFVSREMKGSEISDHMACSYCRINANKMRLKDFEVTEDYAKLKELCGKTILISDSPKLSLDELRAIARKWRDEGVSVIFVDYLQLMYSGNARDYNQAATEVASQAKEIAREFDMHVCMLSQLSRPPKGTRAEPELSDLRDSGSLEQAADMVFMLSRNEKDKEDNSMLNCFVRKNRNGRTGHARLMFIRSEYRVEDMKYDSDTWCYPEAAKLNYTESPDPDESAE